MACSAGFILDPNFEMESVDDPRAKMGKTVWIVRKDPSISWKFIWKKPKRKTLTEWWGNEKKNRKHEFGLKLEMDPLGCEQKDLEC